MMESPAQARIKGLEEEEDSLRARRETISANSEPYRDVGHGESGPDNRVIDNLTESIEKVRKEITQLGGTPREFAENETEQSDAQVGV
jgi:L-lactate utilization protein LutB